MKCPFCDNDHFPQGGVLEDFADDFVTLIFDSGRVYDVPVHLDHYITDHSFQPPKSLVGDLMNARHVPEGALFASEQSIKVRMGEDCDFGSVPASVPYRLRMAIQAVVKRNG